MPQIRLRSWIAALLCCTAGCSALQDHWIDMETDLRNHILAQRAWGEWSWCYDELDQPKHFAGGFKDGYIDVINGGNGCQPTLPPKCYWKPHYQSPEGRSCVEAWFDGFSHGALAAQQDGQANLGQIPISPTARMNLNSRNVAVPAPWTASKTAPIPVPESPPLHRGAAAPEAETSGPALNRILPPIDPEDMPEARPLRDYEGEE